jgi:hypothetical protein
MENIGMHRTAKSYAARMVRISTIASGILAATLLVWLSTVAVTVPSSVALALGILSGVLDGTFLAFPVLLLGFVLHLSLRKRRQDPIPPPLSPLQAGLLGTWLANAAVLAIINALALMSIVSSGRHIGEGGLIYIVVLFTWGLSIGAGVAGWGIAVILRDRRQARSS